MLKKLNKTKIFSLIIGLGLSSSVGMSQANVLSSAVNSFVGAQAKEWPVSDSAVRKSLLAISQHFENNANQSAEMAKLAENNTFSQNYAMARVATLSKDGQKLYESDIDVQKCVAMTRAMANDGVGKSKAILKQTNSTIQSNLDSTNAEKASSLRGRKSSGICTARDVAYNIDGCTAKDIDPVYAGARERGNLLTTNLEDGESPTLSEKQFKIALDSIQDMAQFIPSSETAGVNSSLYNKERDHAVKAISQAQNMMAYVLAQHAPQKLNPNSPDGISYFKPENQETAKYLFGSQPSPTPSLSERRRMYAYLAKHGQDVAAYHVGDQLMNIRAMRDLLADGRVDNFEQMEKMDLIISGLAIIIEQNANRALKEIDRNASAGH